VRTENPHATLFKKPSQPKAQEFGALNIGYESGTSNPSFISVAFRLTRRTRVHHTPTAKQRRRVTDHLGRISDLAE